MKRSLGIVAAALVIACFLPSEPSGADRVTFVFDVEPPYRVPLAGSIEPPIQIAADGRVLQGAAYRLESLDSGLVRIDETGRGLEGIGRGSASVRVVYQSATGTRDTVFEVQVVVSRIAVDPASLSFTRLGATARLRATAYNANDAPVPKVEFTWSTADLGVATVDDTGLVTAVDEGTVEITAEADGVADSSAVAVTQVAALVQLAPDLDTLYTVGRSVQFIAVAFDSSRSLLRTARAWWSSSDTSVAQVNERTGLAVAAGGGTARIIARVGSAADTATLVVAQVVRFIFLTPAFDTLTAIADTTRLAAQATDSGGAPVGNASVAWATSDAAIATVDQAGLVMAAQNGVVLVTASAGAQSAFGTIVVRQVAVAARIGEENVTLTGVGSTVRLSGTGLDRNGFVVSDAALSWRSGHTCVATVDGAGVVTARADGETAVVAAPVDGGRSDTAGVTVTGTTSLQGDIAFEVYGPTDGGIMYVCADGTGLRQLIAGNPDRISNFPMTPDWSPDGTNILFSRAAHTSGSSCGGGLRIAGADGSEERAITEGCDFNPAWSPDGTRIALTRQVYLDPDNSFRRSLAIYIANADGSNARWLGGGSSIDNSWSDPTWSPDGTRLAFTASSRTAASIASVNGDGTGFTTVVAGSHPLWSPDGSRLAFYAHGSVVVTGPDGLGSRVLVPGWYREVDYGYEELNNWPLAWSPDGTYILFAYNTVRRDYGGSYYGGGLSYIAVESGQVSDLPLPSFAYGWTASPPTVHSATWRRSPPP